MKWRIFACSLMLAISLFYGTAFSSDNHRGKIDTFLLQRELAQEGYSKIQQYLSNLKDNFPAKEPIFITMDDTIHPINMPTNMKPFIIIINNAENIIYENPHIFSLQNIENKISFKSENRSNQAINANLANRIIPIDHCTYIKKNKDSIDIVSLFFDKKALFEWLIQTQPIPQQREIPSSVKKKRVPDFLSTSNKNPFSQLEFFYEKHEKTSALHRANRRYFRVSSGYSRSEESD